MGNSRIDGDGHITVYGTYRIPVEAGLWLLCHEFVFFLERSESGGEVCSGSIRFLLLVWGLGTVVYDKTPANQHEGRQDMEIAAFASKKVRVLGW